MGRSRSSAWCSTCTTSAFPNFQILSRASRREFWIFEFHYRLMRRGEWYVEQWVWIVPGTFFFISVRSSEHVYYEGKAVKKVVMRIGFPSPARKISLRHRFGCGCATVACVCHLIRVAEISWVLSAAIEQATVKKLYTNINFIWSAPSLICCSFHEQCCLALAGH